MMAISYKWLGNSIRGGVLWQTTCLALIWVVQEERNTRIFYDKVKTSEVLWDIIHFFASFWASNTTTFKGIHLNIIQLDWMSMRSSKGVGQQGLINICIFLYWL